MSRKGMVSLVGLLALIFLVRADERKPAEPAKPAQPAYRLSGPYVHGNLTLFLIHGESQLKGRKILTLDEALEQKKVIVHETKNVQQLSVENVSPDHDVFIAAGDIVKGGDQDRVLAFDLIVPAKSGKMPVASFCVEHGRWSQRGGEENKSFGSSKDQIATKELKLANRAAADQSQVWKRVAMAQKQISDNLGTKVQDGKSESSLQLSLENKKLVETVFEYAKKLAPVVEGQKDVIGFAFAINGQMNSTDVYASSELFLKLWPKLLKASCVEAVAEMKKDKTFPAVTAEQVKAFLAEAAKGKKTEKDVNARLKQIQCDAPRCVQFETQDRGQKGVSLRQNTIAK